MSNRICQNCYQKIPLCKIHALALKFAIFMYPQQKIIYLSSTLPESPSWNLSCIAKIHLLLSKEEREAMCLQKRKKYTSFLIQGILTTLFFLQWTTPSSPLHLLINAIAAAQLKELVNFCAAERHFARRPIPEHSGFCPIQDVILLHTSHVTQVADKCLDSIAGGPPVSAPITYCISSLTYAISKAFVAWF